MLFDELNRMSSLTLTVKHFPQYTDSFCDSSLYLCQFINAAKCGHQNRKISISIGILY